jgi:hypothetical protein
LTITTPDHEEIFNKGQILGQRWQVARSVYALSADWKGINQAGGNLSLQKSAVCLMGDDGAGGEIKHGLGVCQAGVPLKIEWYHTADYYDQHQPETATYDFYIYNQAGLEKKHLGDIKPSVNIWATQTINFTPAEPGEFNIVFRGNDIKDAPALHRGCVITQLSYPDNSASDTWTITGTIPDPLTTPQTVTFTLLKNSKASGTKENVSIRLDTNDYLTVDPAASITTEADGTFKLTLTPAAGQTTAHNTALTLTHDGQDTKFTVTTGGAPAAKYDIKVYKDSDGKNPIDLNTVNTWTANTGHYVYVSVVKHGTSERVDTASINIAASPTTALVPLTSPVKIENGTLARVAFKPGTSASGNATITFSTTIDGQECLAELKVYLGESGSLEVVTPTPITLSPGIERTPSGDLAILDVRFNPQVSGAVPEISFRVDGDDLTVLSEENIFVTDGVLKPADPKGNGDYRILPVLKTDKNASGPAKITFFIDKVKYPQEAAKWKQVTVTVNISSVDHVKWSVASGALVDTGSNPTVLKTGLKAYDANGKEMSSYVMDVHIVTDDVDATFVDNTLTHRLTGPDSTGWARLPEMIVGQKTGKIHLQALLPGGGGYLKEELLLNVTAAQRPKDIVIHPNGVYPISWDDLDSGKFTHDSSRYAQLNDAGGHAIHSGKVTFTIAANTANARMATPDEVSTPTVKTVDVNANGRAFWPDIIIGNTTGAFTLTASNPDVIAAQTVKITVS